VEVTVAVVSNWSRLLDALNRQALVLNDENRVEECWYLRGMADAVEWVDKHDDERAILYESAKREAGIYRQSYASGWNNAARLSDAFATPSED
jgi:hypothetical protein